MASRPRLPLNSPDFHPPVNGGIQATGTWQSESVPHPAEMMTATHMTEAVQVVVCCCAMPMVELRPTVMSYCFLKGWWTVVDLSSVPAEASIRVNRVLLC